MSREYIHDEQEFEHTQSDYLKPLIDHENVSKSNSPEVHPFYNQKQSCREANRKDNHDSDSSSDDEFCHRPSHHQTRHEFIHQPNSKFKENTIESPTDDENSNYEESLVDGTEEIESKESKKRTARAIDMSEEVEDESSVDETVKKTKTMRKMVSLKF